MHIRRLIVALLFTLLLAPLTYAQVRSTMTDDQVMSFIMRESQKGTPRSAIMTKLVERGVTVDQVRRIRRKYEMQSKSNSTLGAKDLTGFDKKQKDRLRQQNGEEKEDPNAQNYRRKRFDNNKEDKVYISEKQRKKRQLRQEDELDDGLSFALPDTFDLDEEDYFEIKDKRDKKQKKKVFGRDIFNNKKLTFESDMNIATPDDYRLGPGDAVFVDVWGASQKNFESTVSPDGTIDIEGFGPINVSGLTVAQANARLRSTLGARYQSSKIRLTVGQTKTISVNVMGEVKNPGTYTLSAFATVFNALYMAGGTNDIGTLRSIKVYRHGKAISTVDIYDYILNGKLSGNVRLTSGDVIYVGPYECLVDITGKVKRPMYYEMKHTESVGTLIKYAGGFTGDAYRTNVRLIRKSGGMYSIHTVDEFERNKFQMMDGDSVSVDSTLNRFSNLVEIKGAIFRPGQFQMNGTISTVRQLLEAAGGFTEDAIANHAVMHRLKEDRTLEVLAIDLKELVDHNIPDVSLKNGDVLYVPSRKDLLDAQTLTISGEVAYPGVYVYADNTTIEDFILQAGGLTDAASTMKVDVSRRIRNSKALTAPDQIARSYSFQLKDGFVIQGEPGFVLEPFDEVYVRRSPGYAEQEHIKVEGEVMFAGVYTLTRKTARLSDLIKEAGGLTKEAYAKGAHLERNLSPQEQIKEQATWKMITARDSTKISKLNGDVRNIGINLDKALESPGSDKWDIVLQGGDKIVVPKYNNTVSINGEVMYPNTVAYTSGQGLSYYINQAGGYSLTAKRRDVFAVNMNGTVTKIRSAKDIQPGCEIVVPAKSKRRGLAFAEWISLGSIVATLGAVVATLIKK